MNEQVLVKVNVPEVATKELSLKISADGKRKLTISSNWLPLFSFEKGMKVEERLIGDGEGFTIEPASVLTPKPKQVYSRTYKRRRNNPFMETLTETSSQKLLDKALPKYTKKVLVIFEQNKITVKPVVNRLIERVSAFLRSSAPLTAFSVCSSGVDASAAHKEGFELNGVVEYRPNEKRDVSAGRDLTESGALTFIENVPVKALFNEDIYEMNPDHIAEVMKHNQSNLLTISLSCDDFSAAKSGSLRDKSLDDLSTGIDMIYPALKLIERMNFTSVLLEQVVSFGRSAIGKLWNTALRRMGYQTYECVINPSEYGYDGNRPRYFHFATILKGTPFSWPTTKVARNESLWERLITKHLPSLRDVTGNSAMQKGLSKNHRLRPITPDSTKVPCILKSQSRMAADSVVVMPDPDTVLWPSEALIKEVMGMEDFKLNCVSADIASEQIGQAVHRTHYREILKSVKEHLIRGHGTQSLALGM